MKKIFCAKASRKPDFIALFSEALLTESTISDIRIIWRREAVRAFGAAERTVSEIHPPQRRTEPPETK